MYLRQSTASQEILLGRFVDSVDGDTEETGLTIANTDIKLHKHGATTLASKNSGGATHIANGNYSAVLDATDTDTLGNLEVHVHVAGALSAMRQYVVLPANTFDALVLGTDVLNVDVTQFGGSNGTFSGGRPEVNTTHLAGTAYAAADLSTTMKASVNAEVLDVLNVDTFAEIGQETPVATQTIRKMLGYLYKFMRNRTTVDGTTIKVYNDDATTVGQKSTHADSGGTYDRGEFTTGP